MKSIIAQQYNSYLLLIYIKSINKNILLKFIYAAQIPESSNSFLLIIDKKKLKIINTSYKHLLYLRVEKFNETF